MGERAWVAKFTAVAPQLDSPLETHTATFDRFALVLPDSSFKGGHKPELVIERDETTLTAGLDDADALIVRQILKQLGG